ncbi:CDP-6-deoxy-delta-3,4-glucoseen reductase [soil metagenome]
MSFEVRLEPSGKTFQVEADEPILTMGLRAHINMPYGCRMGTCCSCRGKIVSGTVDLGHAHPTYLPQDQRDEGFALLCQATARSDVVIEVEELPDLAEPQVAPALVKKIEFLAPDVARLHVRLPLHINLRFAAGQYVDLLFENGVRRSYSIANPPRTEGVIDFEFHVRHMPGGLFTDRLFGGMKAREKVEFEGPLGTFFLRESAKPAILLASGTGYAPIRSILLDALPRLTGRKITLYWGARSLRDIYLFDEAQALAEQYPDFRFVPVLSEALPEDRWTGRTGFVHQAVMADIPDMGDVQVYACGAPAMVDAARSDFVRLCGLPESEFFADSFVSSADAVRELA